MFCVLQPCISDRSWIPPKRTCVYFRLLSVTGQFTQASQSPQRDTFSRAKHRRNRAVSQEFGFGFEHRGSAFHNNWFWFEHLLIWTSLFDGPSTLRYYHGVHWLECTMISILCIPMGRTLDSRVDRIPSINPIFTSAWVYKCGKCPSY